ncbi:MAG: hypothetical protein KatS3mg034_0601 [Vicingaceae bacterium]|jgi:anti-sigma B factor antagonist|nr:MAG: hypothetical protein KatS3mg034_0601 [Vicingaceae bacterium]
MLFQFERKKEKNYITYYLKGRCLDDYSTVKFIESLQDDILDEHKLFIVNLQDLELINSAGLNALIKALTMVRNNGGELVVTNVPDQLKKMFLMTRLNTVFHLVENNKEAEKYFKEIEKNEA